MAAFEAGSGPGGMPGGGVDLDDILSQMFGMGGGMGGMGGMPPGFGGPGGPGGPQRGPRKGRDEETSYPVTLEDFYKGKTVKFVSTKKMICSLCKGSGGKEKAKPHQCSTCGGRGMVQGLRQIGPGLVTQETMPCSSCKGTGKVFKDKEKCKKCKGERVTEEKKALELYIPRGSRLVSSMNRGLVYS
jgi:DnaJ homolog subfamily A member 2